MAGAPEHVARLDLARMSVREVNDLLHHGLARDGAARIEILNPNGMHNLAAGVDAALEIDILGHGGYFVAGMNKQARITVHGSVGWSVAENIMSGTVRVHRQRLRMYRCVGTWRAGHCRGRHLIAMRHLDERV